MGHLSYEYYGETKFNFFKRWAMSFSYTAPKLKAVDVVK